MDDAHIVCTPDQLVDEILRVFEFTQAVHATFGFTDPVVELSTLPTTIVTPRWPSGRPARSATPSSGAASSTASPRARDRSTARRSTSTSPTRSADCGSSRPCSATSACRTGSRWSTSARTTSARSPVMIHRAILGSIERFTAVLIEHYAGAFPPGSRRSRSGSSRSPTGTSSTRAGSRRASARRACVRGRRERRDVGKKVRSAQVAKAPYVLVIGDKEIESASSRSRPRGHRDQGRGVRRVRRGAGRGGGHPAPHPVGF